MPPDFPDVDHDDDLLAREALADVTEIRWEDANLVVDPEQGDGP